MIQLKNKFQLAETINPAKKESCNSIVKMTNKVRMFRAENAKSGKTYIVNFYVRIAGKRFTHCYWIADKKISA